MPQDAESRHDHFGDAARPRTHDHTGSHGATSEQHPQHSQHSHSHSWQRAGGGSVLAASILLVGATWVEFLVLGPGAPMVVYALFLVAFGLSMLLFAVAGFALARYGLVGESAGRRFALRAFGVCWAVSQIGYLGYKYFLPPSTWNFGLVVVSTGFLALTFVFGIASAVVIAASRIAWGPARWSLFLALGLSTLAGVVISSSDSLLLLTIMETISALGLVLVGVTYWRAPGRDPWIAG